MSYGRKPHALASVRFGVDFLLNLFYKLFGGFPEIRSQNRKQNRPAGRKFFLFGGIENRFQPAFRLVVQSVYRSVIPRLNRRRGNQLRRLYVPVPHSRNLCLSHPRDCVGFGNIILYIPPEGLVLKAVKISSPKLLGVLLVLSGNQQFGKLGGLKAVYVVDWYQLSDKVISLASRLFALHFVYAVRDFFHSAKVYFPYIKAFSQNINAFGSKLPPAHRL